jgi:poly-gamma-glutamate capsule biosynthesis protein CapA/YwtB (metallophosphatase superfamily)
MSISLISIGDVMLGENVHHFQRGIVKKFRNNYTSLIRKEIKDSFKGSDFVLINLESSLAPDEFFITRNIKNGVYVAPEESIGLIKELNHNIIANIANNHFSQHGIESASYTIKKLENEGILVVGKDNKPRTIVKNGICLKIWGVSLIIDTHACEAYFKSTYEALLNDIYTEPKPENEFWIISIHWGEEYFTKENENQRVLAKKLSDAGFDLILGHHPHVIQPVDKIGVTEVVYSHGNFIFDQNFSKLTQKGLVCRFNFPINKPKYLFSQQKDLRVIAIVQTEKENLSDFCEKEYNYKNPLLMRIKMKLELIRHFYELNSSILKAFLFRFLQK